jgi:hypothetical protein
MRILNKKASQLQLLLVFNDIRQSNSFIWCDILHLVKAKGVCLIVDFVKFDLLVCYNFVLTTSLLCIFVFWLTYCNSVCGNNEMRFQFGIVFKWRTRRNITK